MKRISVFMALAFVAGCGDDSEIELETGPTGAEVRAFWGLESGSCWRYRRSGGRVETFATVTVGAPASDLIAGRTVYPRAYRPDNTAGSPTFEQFFEAENGEILLVRQIEGLGTERVVSTYEMEPLPVFGKFRFDKAGAVALDGARFETVSIPEGGASQTHAWTVLSESDEVVTDTGMAQAIKLSYSVAGRTATYYLVPGYGFAKFTDFDGVSHQVCAARICGVDGKCEGVSACTNEALKCDER